MSRLLGLLKTTLILAADFIVIYGLFKDIYIALGIVGAITLYTIFGGYFALLKDSAISSQKLPSYQRSIFETAKSQLVTDVKSTTGNNISRIKLYLVPGDDEMNATAYGCNCISVTRGTFDNADSITLNAVLAHEISHILNFDAEFNRAVFCSVTLLIGAFSVMSFTTVTIVFLGFLVLSCFRSWFWVIAFRGISKIIRGMFDLIQRGIIMTYRSVLSLINRHAEYRSDRYSCLLGYGLQLSHFLMLTEQTNQRPLTLTEVIYQSHPPTPKRIERLEKQLLAQQSTELTNR